MFVIQLILNPSQEQQIAVECGPNTIISPTRRGHYDVQKMGRHSIQWNTHTHTCTTKKKQDAIAVILGQEGKTHMFSQMPFFAGSRSLAANPNK